MLIRLHSQYKTDKKINSYTFLNTSVSKFHYWLLLRLHHPAASEFRRRLRSASSYELSIPRTRLSTYSDWAFPVAAVRIWNSLRHFLSSAVAWRRTSSNSVTRNYCCRAREVTLSFMDTLIALTYLLTYLLVTSGKCLFSGTHQSMPSLIRTLFLLVQHPLAITFFS